MSRRVLAYPLAVIVATFDAFVSAWRHGTAEWGRSFRATVEWNR